MQQKDFKDGEICTKPTGVEKEMVYTGIGDQ